MALVVGILYTYVIATPTYRSTAVVMLNNREEQVVDVGSVLGGLGSDTEVVNTEVEILRSRSLLAKVVDDLELISDPEFNKSLVPPSNFSKLKSKVRTLLSPTFEPSRSNEMRQMQSTIDALLASLTIRNIPQSLVFEVTVETTSPEKSARIADALVDLYILNQLEVKFEATEQATTWLTERVTDLQVELENAEEKVKDFRASTTLVSQEQLEGLEVQVKDIRERIDDTQADQENLQTQLESIRAATDPREVVEITRDSQLQGFLPRIEDPSVAEKFQTRLSEIETRLQLNIDRDSAQLSSLRSSLRSLEKQIERQSEDLIELQQLTREAEASRLLYEYFLTRLKETSAQQGVQQADSRMISPAVIPPEPASPRKRFILVSSITLGFILGVGLVLLLESRNRSFRTATQLEEVTGYSTIGQLPLIPARRRKDAISYLKEKPSSAAAEAIRNLRTSVMLSNIDNPPKVIMTSSAVSGEGKTTVALSLALNFSSMGKKVLLVEGEIRRRVFGQYLNADRSEGIVKVLDGSRTFDEVVVNSELLGVDVLLGDEGKSNAADIFSSERFSSLIAELRDRYDIIIIDTPPVLIVPDARVIAQQVDTTVFVVKWDGTEQEQVIAALREFESVSRPVSGLVLNQISPRGMKRYGYGNSYGPYSAYGSKYYIN